MIFTFGGIALGFVFGFWLGIIVISLLVAGKESPPSPPVQLQEEENLGKSTTGRDL